MKDPSGSESGGDFVGGVSTCGGVGSGSCVSGVRSDFGSVSQRPLYLLMIFRVKGKNEDRRTDEDTLL